jgi:hypothetical protein
MNLYKIIKTWYILLHINRLYLNIFLNDLCFFNNLKLNFVLVLTNFYKNYFLIYLNFKTLFQHLSFSIYFFKMYLKMLCS